MKFTKYFLSLAAAIAMIAGCQKQEMVQTVAPEDVVVPVLESVDYVVITPTNKDLGTVTFNWRPADYGVQTQIDYELEITSAGKGRTVLASGSDVKAVVPYESLLKAVLTDMELTPGADVDVQFYVSARVGETAKVYSAPVAAKINAAAERPVYNKLFIVGSYNGWKVDKENLYIYDFAAEDKLYQGVIDFGEEHASNEFKFTAGGWGNDEHSVPGGTAVDAEAKTIPLVAGGGDNVKAYTAKRFYHIAFDRTALTLTKNASFDKIEVVGDQADATPVAMTYHPSNQRFYADVEFTAAGNFVFKLDGEVSYGLSDNGYVVENGTAVPVKAGKYRVYLDLNNYAGATCLADHVMYDQEEPVVSDVVEVTYPETMYMIGKDFGDWKWDSEDVVTMNPVASDNGVGQFWAVRYIKAGVGFKYCAKRAWDGDFHSLETNDGYKEDGGNCVVEEDGLYMIHIDLKREMVHIEKARIYGIGNCFGGWTAGNADALFTVNADGKAVSPALLNSDEIRIYVESSISNTDWWTREFIFFDGKIAYRGNGGDQERVKGEAGQVVTLDFNAGTATLN